MSVALDVIELLGVGADLADARVVAGLATLDPALRDAVAARDATAVTDLLGGRRAMACAVFAPEPEDQPLREEEDDVPTDVPVEREARAA